MNTALTAQGYGWSRYWNAKPQDSLYLMPGGVYIGNQVSELKTLLGSCVAVTLWHPRHKIAAMTHIVLPGTSGNLDNPKYATGAIHLLTRVILSIGCEPKEFKTGVYGGGRMFSHDDSPKVIDIGQSNVKKTLSLLRETGYRVSDQDTLGHVYRHILMDRLTGCVRVKTTSVSSTMT